MRDNNVKIICSNDRQFSGWILKDYGDYIEFRTIDHEYMIFKNNIIAIQKE